MKNLSQFRKELTVGSQWTVEHQSDFPESCRPPAPRAVMHVQSNAVAFRMLKVIGENPHKSGSWLYFERQHGKAGNWAFPDDNTAIFTCPGASDNGRMIIRRAPVTDQLIWDANDRALAKHTSEAA